MKIAFPADGKVISGHFGHCAEFKVFDIDDKRILSFVSYFSSIMY